MAKEITMPALSPSMSEGTLARWLKKEGDEIKVGDVIAEVETDKATMDLEAFEGGTLLKIVVPDGTNVAVNARIAFVGKPGEKIDEALLASVSSTPAPKKEAPKVETSTLPASSSSVPSPVVSQISHGRVKASPLAKKIARERGIQIASLTGSGPGGRILKRDVLSAPAGGSSGSLLGSGPIAKDERVVLTNMRKTIAKRLLESKTQVPHFYLEMEIDAEPLVTARAAINAALEKAPQPTKLSLNDFVLKACACALRSVPLVNASFEGDAIRMNGAVHISFAVAIPEGLITPVIRDAHTKSIAAIANEAKKLAVRAKEGDLKPEEYSGGTFTVSNLGMLGIDRFSAIINPPQAAILAVGGVIKKPVVNGQNQIVAGQRMSLTLSCDHRVVDGAVGATFLAELKKFLENPSLIVL